MVENSDYTTLNDDSTRELHRIGEMLEEVTDEEIRENAVNPSSTLMTPECFNIVHTLIDFVHATDECCYLQSKYVRCKANASQLSGNTNFYSNSNSNSKSNSNSNSKANSMSWCRRKKNRAKRFPAI